jgi:hypothetical protein
VRLRPGRLAALLAALAIVVTGCSGATPLSNPSPDHDAAASAESGGASSADPSGPAPSGLSAGCSAAIEGQAAVAGLFAQPVDGRRLSEAEVATVFDGIGTNLPAELQDAVGTLHDAAERAVGKSDVDVASILAEQPVADAMTALSAFVKGCSPPAG